MRLRHTGVGALALTACGCVPQMDAKGSDEQIARFYQRVSAKQYEAIYQDSAPELKNSVTPALFTGMMQRIDRKLGACGAPQKQMSWRVNVTNTGTFRDQGYVRACANGKLDETVTTVTRAGKTVLAGYHANSPLLMTD
jgi:hypothetical protein